MAEVWEEMFTRSPKLTAASLRQVPDIQERAVLLWRELCLGSRTRKADFAHRLTERLQAEAERAGGEEQRDPFIVPQYIKEAFSFVRGALAENVGARSSDLEEAEKRPQS